MSNTDFTGPTVKAPLTLRPGDNAWGPFEFDCSPGLPGEVTIEEASVKSYDSEGAEVDIIESGSIDVVNDTSVQLKFSAGEDIEAGKYYLRFELSLVNGGKKFFRFGPVQIMEWDSE